MNMAFLILRLVLGTAMAAHGAQKLFGWFGGHGLKGTGRFMEQLGFSPGPRFALAAGLGELGGGGLLALGLFGPVGPALVIMVMVVAMATVHRGHGFFAMTNGAELPLLYITGALAALFGGPGAYSLDAMLGLNPHWTPAVQWASLGAAGVLALGNLAVRRTPHPTEAASA